MNCPVDGTELQIGERPGVEIDYCPWCRGVRLDRNELDKIIDHSVGIVQPTAHYRRSRREGFSGDLFDFGDWSGRSVSRCSFPANVKKESKGEQNLDGYGVPPIPWTKICERLEQRFTQVPGSGGPDRHTYWLATVHPDGRPHVMPLGVDWMDGALCFRTGANTRKAKNLAHNPQCVITVATHDFDIIV
jgi:Zn-finger nucleic acid-binding protein